MTSRVAATRYARALFDVALAEGQDLDQIGRELSEHRRARLGQRGARPGAHARRRFRRHGSGRSWRRCCRTAPVNALLARTLLLLADRDRLALLPRLRRRVPLAAHGSPAGGACRGDDGDGAAGRPGVGAAAGPGDGDRTDSAARRARRSVDCRRRGHEDRQHGLRRQRHDAARAAETAGWSKRTRPGSEGAGADTLKNA